MSLKKIVAIGFLSFLMVSNVYARNKDKQVPHLYPYVPNMERKHVDPVILQDRFELNLDPSDVKSVYTKKRRYQDLMDGVYDLHILQEPIIKPIQNSDFLFVHPKFITTILFPKELKITFARSSFDPNVFEFSENMIMVQPHKNFNEGNLIVTLSDKKRNYMVNIVLQKFDFNMVSYDTYFNRYVSPQKIFLSLYYRYVYPPKFSKVKLLQVYFKLSGIDSYDELLARFSQNGSSDSFVVQGIPFYITRDDKFGEVEYKDLSFRITNSPIKVQ